EEPRARDCWTVQSAPSRVRTGRARQVRDSRKKGVSRMKFISMLSIALVLSVASAVAKPAAVKDPVAAMKALYARLEKDDFSAELPLSARLAGLMALDS